MNPRDEVAAVADMIDAAERAIAYAAHTTQDDLPFDSMRLDAILRVLGVLGEAVTRLTPETQKGFAAVPWAKMRAIRNHLIHRYDRVEVAIVWETVAVHIPAALADLRVIHPQLLAEQLPQPEAP